jgi:hypothetical protein
MREEELIKISVISFERLATLLRHGVEGRLDDVVLVDVGSVGARVSPFMVDMCEVVESPTESPKYIVTQNKQEEEAPPRSCRNQIV